MSISLHYHLYITQGHPHQRPILSYTYPCLSFLSYTLSRLASYTLSRIASYTLSMFRLFQKRLNLCSDTTKLSRPDPSLTRLVDPNRSPGRETNYTIYYILYCTVTLIDLFFLRVVPVPVGIQTIYVITKIILHIQKNYHRSGVHHNLYTYTESHLLIHVQFLLQNIRDCGSSAGEHLSPSRPSLLMWNVLSSSLLFGTYTD